MELQTVSEDGTGKPLEVRINHPLVTCGARMVVLSSVNVIDSYDVCTTGVTPIIVYAFQARQLRDEVCPLSENPFVGHVRVAELV